MAAEKEYRPDRIRGDRMNKFTDEEKNLIAKAFEAMFNRNVNKLAELNPVFRDIFTKCGILGGKK